MQYVFDTTSSTFSYDPVGNRTTVQDTVGTATFVFDAMGRITDMSPYGERVTFAYDLAGNKTRISSTAPIRIFEYDNDSRLSTFTDVSGGITTRQFDSAGRLTTMILPSGLKRRITFDAAGQIVSQIDDALDGTIRQSMASNHEADGLELLEHRDNRATTLMWDGTDYLGGKA